MKGTYLAGIHEDMDLVFPSVLEWMRRDILVRTSCSDQVSEYTYIQRRSISGANFKKNLNRCHDAVHT